MTDITSKMPVLQTEYIKKSETEKHMVSVAYARNNQTPMPCAEQCVKSLPCNLREAN